MSCSHKYAFIQELPRYETQVKKIEDGKEILWHVPVSTDYRVRCSCGEIGEIFSTTEEAWSWWRKIND